MLRIVRFLAVSLQKRLIVLIVRFTSFSPPGIRLVKSLLLPVYGIRNTPSWPLVVRYLKILLPEMSAVKSLFRYYWNQVDRIVWSTLGYNAWDRTLKYHDFSRVDDLRIMAGRGQGLLLLGLHNGPMFSGYLFHRRGLNPAILLAQANIPDIDRIPWKGLLTKEFTFRGTYDGMVTANHSERRFIKMMLAGRPGMMMMDVIEGINFLTAKCLGINYPIGIFPFKLALTHNFPVAVIWFSKIKGNGYQLNSREICFSTLEEGVAQYGSFLDQVVRADPFLWNYGPLYASYYGRAFPERSPRASLDQSFRS